MSVQVATLDDFSGGQVDALSSADFAEGQWAELYGVLLGEQRALHAQWALHQLDDREVTSWALFDGVIAYRVETAEGPVWVGGGLPLDSATAPGIAYRLLSDVTLLLDDPDRGVLDQNLLGDEPAQDGD